MANFTKNKKRTLDSMAQESPTGERLSSLREISDTGQVSENVEMIAEAVLGVALNHTDAERGSVMLVNKAGEFYLAACRGMDSADPAYELRKGEGIALTVAEGGRGVLVRNIGADARFVSNPASAYKTKSFICCPLLHTNKVIGLINVSDKKTGDSFSEDEFAFLNILANQAAITFENAYLMSELRSKASELEQANRMLLESDAAKNEFIIRISHELRTPLNSIKGSIYYLGSKKRISRNKQKEFFDIIAHGANELRNRVENLISFLRRENKQTGARAGEASKTSTEG